MTTKDPLSPHVMARLEAAVSTPCEEVIVPHRVLRALVQVAHEHRARWKPTTAEGPPVELPAECEFGCLAGARRRGT